ncbi:MAG: rhodanese-like domain-containing protein [Acidobacteria bacterium]|nr:rhodanese-like domain-containing protein [Acidobacteriota bacterium]
MATRGSVPAADRQRGTNFSRRCQKAFDDGSAIFIDTRADSTYKLEHIKGSINIPAGTVDANMSKLSKGKKLIAYCS